MTDSFAFCDTDIARSNFGIQRTQLLLLLVASRRLPPHTCRTEKKQWLAQKSPSAHIFWSSCYPSGFQHLSPVDSLPPDTPAVGGSRVDVGPISSQLHSGKPLCALRTHIQLHINHVSPAIITRGHGGGVESHGRGTDEGGSPQSPGVEHEVGCYLRRCQHDIPGDCVCGGHYADMVEASSATEVPTSRLVHVPWIRKSGLPLIAYNRQLRQEFLFFLQLTSDIMILGP